MTIKKQIGRLLIFGGISLAGYQAYLWYLNGAWTSFPLSILAVEMVRYLGAFMANMPAASEESVQSVVSFSQSDFPFYLRQFFNLIPISVFLIFVGNVFWKWEKLLGPSLKT